MAYKDIEKKKAWAKKILCGTIFKKYRTNKKKKS